LLRRNDRRGRTRYAGVAAGERLFTETLNALDTDVIRGGFSGDQESC
jgi:hypothetical protein